MAAGAGGRAADLSDVERDMLLLAIVGKSARQVALTALRIEAVKDIIIGSLTDFLVSHFSVGYVNHNVADSASSLDDRDTTRSTAAVPRSAAVPTGERSGPLSRIAVGARKAVAGEAAAAIAYARGSCADAYTLPALPRLQAPSEVMLPIDSPEPSDDHGSAVELHQLSAAMLPLAPHKRLLTSRPASRLDRLVQQRRPYDSHAATALDAAESLDEDRPSRRDSNGWTVGNAQAMAADGSAEDCSGAGRGLTASGAPGQCRPFTPLARDAAAALESGSSAAGDSGGASSRFAKNEVAAAAEPPAGRTAAAAGRSPAGDHYSSVVACKQQSLQPSSSSSMASSSADAATSRRRSSDHMNDDDDQWDGSGSAVASGPAAGGASGADAAAELRGASRLQHDGATASAYRESTSGQSGVGGGYSSWYPATRKRRSVLPPMPLSSYVEQSGRRAAAGGSGGGGGLRSSVGRGQLNYMCPECSKDFRRQSELNRHVKIVHRQEKPYRCEECGIPFATRWNLKCHYNKQHFQQPYPSQVDGRSARAAAAQRSLSRRGTGQAAQKPLDDEEDDGGQQEGGSGGGGSSGASAADMGFDGIGCPEGIVVVEPEPPAPEAPYRVRGGGSDRLFLEAPNLKLEGGD